MSRTRTPSLISAAGIAILSTGLTIGKPAANSEMALRVAAMGHPITVVRATVVNGRMLIPIGDSHGLLDGAHALFGRLGARAIYDPYFHHLTIGFNGTQLEFLGDNSDAMFDGAPYHLDVAASTRDGVYYIPARSFARAFGISLVWQRSERMLAFGGAPQPKEDPVAVAPAPSPVRVPAPVGFDIHAVPTVQPATPATPVPVRYATLDAQAQPHTPLAASAHIAAEINANTGVGVMLGADAATTGTRSEAYAGVGAPRAGHVYATLGATQQESGGSLTTSMAYGVTKLPDLDLPASAYGSVQYVPLLHALLYRAGVMFAPQSSRLLLELGVSGTRGDDGEYLGLGVRF